MELMEGIRIRKFGRDDAEEVSTLIRKCLLEVNSRDYTKEEINFMIKNFEAERLIKKSRKRAIFVALHKGRIVGVAGAERNEVHNVFVLPEMHGKGIGRMLMERAEEVIREHGYKYAEVASSITACLLYTSPSPRD